MPIATQAPPGTMGPPPPPSPAMAMPPPSPRKNLVSGLERSHSRAGHMRHGSTSSIGHSRGQSFSSLSSIGSLSNLNNLAGGSLPSPLGQMGQPGPMGQMGPPGLPVMPPAPPLGSEIAWTEIQSRTFCKWLNTKLENHGLEPMTSLDKDFSDGVKLIQLLEIMSDSSLGRYNKRPIMRVQKAENAAKALAFIRERGVKLTNIGPEDIVDGNLKLILGMIWTIILRFTISGIYEEGLSAKDGLLLWCQRKTTPYSEVNVQNFKGSWKDGLAFCAIIHRHRPELIDYENLNKADARGNTALAFKVAEESLGIPRLLEVSDVCDVDVPDERSVMTYVAEFFHKFSSEDKAETGARRVELFAEVMKSIWVARNDFERRMSALLTAMHQTRSVWASATPASSYPEAIAQKDAFAEYKRTSKRTWVRERQELSQLYSNIQTKLRTYSLRSWEPRKGLRLEDLEAAWKQLMAAEVARSRSINARIRDIKEALRKEFARVADGFVARLQRAEQVIGSLSGQLQDQKEVLLRLAKELPGLRAFLTGEIDAANRRCLEAKVDENDYTVFTYDDLEFELETTEDGLRKKLAFIDNQIVSAQHTNITPAKLEEFESTFKHFDKDGSNALSVYEMHSALASLGIVYPDEEVEAIYYQLESQFGALTYEAWLALLVEITKDDVSSADQLREAFRDLAGDKGYVTEQDLKFANLGTETVQFLTEVMPAIQEDEAPEQPQRQKQDTTRKPKFDYHGFLEQSFARRGLVP